MKQQFLQIQDWITENRLVKLTYIVEKQGEKVIYGRLIKLDEDDEIILIYVDDEKKVESIHIHAIEDIRPSESSGDRPA